MRNTIFLSVVIPAFNEEKKIGKAITQIRKFFKKKKASFEIIVVDDGSFDKTAREARKAGKKLKHFRVISHMVNKGKGAAIKTGVMASKGKFILFSDADLSTPIGEFERLWRFVESGFDVVIASRGKKESKILRHQGTFREFLGRSFGVLTKTLVLRGINDPQCGFKLFKGDLGRKVFSKVKTNGVLFDVEFLLLAQKEGARIKEVPVIWKHEPDTKIQYNFLSSLSVFLQLMEIKLRLKIMFPVRVK